MSALLKYTGGVIKGMGLEGNRLVSGFYTSSTLDLQGHMIDKNAMLAALEDYRSWGTIREMHDAPIGVAQNIGYPEWDWIDAQVSNTLRGDEVMKLVRDNVYKAFSVGLLVTSGEFVPFAQLKAEDFTNIPLNVLEWYREIGDVFRITGLTLVEVSIVDRPANPMARVQSVRNELGIDTLGALPSLNQPNSIGVIKSAIRSSGFYVPVTEQMVEAIRADNKLASEDIVIQLEVTVSDTENKELDGVVEPAIETPVAEEMVEKEVVETVDVIVADEAQDAIEISEIEVAEKVAEVTEPADSAIGETEKMIGEMYQRLVALDFDAIGKTIADAVVAAIAAANENKEATEEPVEKNKVLLDETQLKGIVDQVVAGVSDIRSHRKGAVNQGGADDAPAPNFKTMAIDELGAYLAKGAAQIRA
jgi:hypothetical protein